MQCCNDGMEPLVVGSLLQHVLAVSTCHVEIHMKTGSEVDVHVNRHLQKRDGF